MNGDAQNVSSANVPPTAPPLGKTRPGSAAEFLDALGNGLRDGRISAVRILVGVSGGADSVALLQGLVELQEEFTLEVHAAHLNHKLRGDASDADADWVRSLCESLAVPAEVDAVDVTALRSGGAAIEETARNLRHRFLEETAARRECSVIATAHTADDQIETVLHHIFRGTGISGLRGIPAERPTASGARLVRPMLSIRRELVESYLAEINQDFRTDATNIDTSLTRNWLRHELMPRLRSQFGVQVDSSLIRLAAQAAEVEATLITLADRLLIACLLDAQPDTVRLDAGSLADQPRHLVREAFRQLWQRQAWPRQGMGFAEWDRVAEVALTGGTATLPGSIEVRRTSASLLVVRRR